MIEKSFFQCLNCNSNNFVVSEKEWVCKNCGHQYPLVHSIPILIRFWKDHEVEMEAARQHNPNWYCETQPAEQQSPWKHHLKKRREYIEQTILQYLNDRKILKVPTLLDLGCGDGNNLTFLQKYTEDLFGSDYNLTRLIRAQQKVPLARLFLSDILDYPVQENFFDIIFFNHVLEHIPADNEALNSVFRILKPGGLLVLGVPNEGALWWQLAYDLEPLSRKTTDHVHFYTEQTISEKLVNNRFKILGTEYLGWSVPHWTLDQKLRKYKIFDDGFELIGRRTIPNQASSLYILATKE